MVEQGDKMVADKEMIAQVRQMAEDNYDSWGQYVVECYTDKELVKDLADFNTLEEWVDIRIAVAEVIAEREWRNGSY
jgi:hypothetical protein